MTICDKTTYTGFLNFRGIDFSYVFADDELKLIAPSNKSDEIRYHWLMKAAGDGVFVNGDPLVVEEKSIAGICNESNGSIIFLPKVGSFIRSTTNLIGNTAPILYIELSAYIVCKYDRKYISRISFSGPEINYIHPANQVFSWSFNEDDHENGVLKIETKDFASTTSKEQLFTVDGATVVSKFGITRGVSMGIGESPLSIHSTLMFEFDPCTDYSFVLRLCRIAKSYIRFLCYRRNICLNEIELSAPYEGGKYEKFATLHLVGEKYDPEEKALKNNRYIRQLYVSDGESKILQDIADSMLYLRHIPDSYESGRHIDAARFVMITAAFEWEFNRMMPEGMPKSDGRKAAEERVNTEIDSLIATRSGREKDIYKFLKKLIGAASLQNEIVTVCEKLDAVVGVFGKRLFAMNHEELSYPQMGKRLSDQRNHYAHGDIDKDFIGLSLLDLIFLEYIVYAMQLKHYGISDDCIRKAINELFHLNFAI